MLRMDTTIRHRGLTGTLHKIGASPFYRLHFRHPSSMERQRISLGTSDLATAKANAKAILSRCIPSSNDCKSTAHATLSSIEAANVASATSRGEHAFS